jgi:hypothetical protein
LSHARTTLACGRRILWRSALILDTLRVARLTRGCRIHEHTKIAHQIYQRADDAISDIQANINKGALIEQSGFSNPNVVESRETNL